MEKRCISTDGRHAVYAYAVEEVVPYINWVYFFHAWGFQPRFASIAHLHGCDACRAMWLASFAEADRAKAAEAMQLHKEALRLLRTEGKNLRIESIFRLCRAQADEDDLWIEGTRFPLLRQQLPDPTAGVCLCLSDFIRPIDDAQPDCIGLFAATVRGALKEEELKEHDPYAHLLMQTLSDRLAEAATEKMHEQIRKVDWGYAPHEDLTIPDLLQEKFQGIRPAVGYPSLPDQSVNFILDELLQLKEVGITLTEHGAMRPHASVCGLMMAHPAARYFSVGTIGDDQLKDYAHRRGLPVEELRKFLRM